MPPNKQSTPSSDKNISISGDVVDSVVIARDNNTVNQTFIQKFFNIFKSDAETFEQRWNIIFLTATVVLLFVSAHSVIIKKYSPDQFLYLAENIVRGSLSVDNMPLNYPDYIIWNGHIFLPPGPLPAIILIPLRNQKPKKTEGIRLK